VKFKDAEELSWNMLEYTLNTELKFLEHILVT
jgi:hypothetical protein